MPAFKTFDMITYQRFRRNNLKYLDIKYEQNGSYSFFNYRKITILISSF